MKVVVLNSDYAPFIQSLYRGSPGLAEKTLVVQEEFRANSLFGVADFYSRAFQVLGHESYEINANIEPQIIAWYKEQRCSRPFIDRLSSSANSLLGRFHSRVSTVRRYVRDRIRVERPDIVLNHDMHIFDAEFWSSLKKYLKILVGQHACTEVWRGARDNWIPFINPKQDFTVYDFIVSSLPSSVKWFLDHGANAHLNRLAIDVERVDAVKRLPRTFDNSFIGSFTPAHTSRQSDLATVAEHVPVHIWAPRTDIPLPPSLQKMYCGEAFGKSMFAILKSSTVTLNHHGNTRDHANNMRLYEAAASGCALVTDWKSDIGELFEPGREILTFRSPEECVEQIKRLHVDANLRKTLSAAARSRCEREHTYQSRMKELLQIVHSSQII